MVGVCIVSILQYYLFTQISQVGIGHFGQNTKLIINYDQIEKSGYIILRMSLNTQKQEYLGPFFNMGPYILVN